jgi:hypothetical protein
VPDVIAEQTERVLDAQRPVELGAPGCQTSGMKIKPEVHVPVVSIV